MLRAAMFRLTAGNRVKIAQLAAAPRKAGTIPKTYAARIARTVVRIYYFALAILAVAIEVYRLRIRRYVEVAPAAPT
jgi:hypothetical protein